MRCDRCRAFQSVLLAIAGIVCWLAAGCASTGGGRQHLGPGTCASLDTLYQDTGFSSPLKMSGKATFDIEQYQVRGQFTLSATPAGDFVFELSSSLLFGSRREDVVISVADGFLRVLDRERGRYYEGAEVDRLLRRNLELNIDTADLISFLLGGALPCHSLNHTVLSYSRDGQVVFTGLLEQRPVKIVFGAAAGRLVQFEWPLMFTKGRADQLRADYKWRLDSSGRPELTELVVKIESRGWRIKLRSES